MGEDEDGGGQDVLPLTPPSPTRGEGDNGGISDAIDPGSFAS
jgi:hypothetical protein